MIAFLATKVWPKVLLVGAFIGLVLLGVLKLLGAGRAQEKAAQAQRNDETRRRMEDAEARGPRTADDVDQRLRDGQF
jgi:hypothetical protein